MKLSCVNLNAPNIPVRSKVPKTMKKATSLLEHVLYIYSDGERLNCQQRFINLFLLTVRQSSCSATSFYNMHGILGSFDGDFDHWSSINSLCPKLVVRQANDDYSSCDKNCIVHG